MGDGKAITPAKGDRQLYLDENQVADMLGMPVRTLQQWRWQRRVLPFVKFGTNVRYRLEDLSAYVEKNVVQPS
jgi:excisionase family DNA binding protein